MYPVSTSWTDSGILLRCVGAGAETKLGLRFGLYPRDAHETDSASRTYDTSDRGFAVLSQKLI
jgi:hypothetical protein